MCEVFFVSRLQRYTVVLMNAKYGCASARFFGGFFNRILRGDGILQSYSPFRITNSFFRKAVSLFLSKQNSVTIGFQQCELDCIKHVNFISEILN